MRLTHNVRGRASSPTVPPIRPQAESIATHAAFVADINTWDPRHIITVEDPIDISIDATGFPTALRSEVATAPDG